MEALCCMVLVLMLHLSWSSSSSVPPPSSPLCLPDQGDASLRFKDTISINRRQYCDYPRTESWNKSIDCCAWEGYTVLANYSFTTQQYSNGVILLKRSPVLALRIVAQTPSTLA
ncbi:hypothetical protein V6N11_025102 [Hibiscus sabdariffa]|uniref:Leucine-rich repeat-containing N-terminal plant-type domain-containing protein n=1 Tax=Hibiscus sabdariffa TaxID=183260 RepID=A0ABR2QP17_9ROSI